MKVEFNITLFSILGMLLFTATVVLGIMYKDISLTIILAGAGFLCMLIDNIFVTSINKRKSDNGNKEG